MKITVEIWYCRLLGTAHHMGLRLTSTSWFWTCSRSHRACNFSLLSFNFYLLFYLLYNNMNPLLTRYICFILKYSASEHGIHVDEVVQRLGLSANKIKSVYLSLPNTDPQVVCTRTHMYTIIFTDFLIVDNNAGKQLITMWMWVIFTRQLMTSTSSLHALTDPISNIYNIVCINFLLLFFFFGFHLRKYFLATSLTLFYYMYLEFQFFTLCCPTNTSLGPCAFLI